MSRGTRETVADWAMMAAALLLLISLFLVWSHQLSPAVVAHYAGTGTFAGIPRNPDAWQVYTTADVLLALVSVGLLVAALRGGRTIRMMLTAAVAVALAFVVHALGTPPTNGANVFNPATRDYVAIGAHAGIGVTVALIALALGAAALLLSFTGDP
ncbi:MAG: hypothetical protein WAL22_17020 [Solirubrobacteraceae bacterium]